MEHNNTAALNAVRAFEQTYRTAPVCTFFTPYRICPLGAHSDHQLGRVTGFAIDRGIHIAMRPNPNGMIELRSLQFTMPAQWHITAIPAQKQNDWADHLRGATIALRRRYPLSIGLCAVIAGELPIGGLSSSAAVIITFLQALCSMNHIKLSSQEMIEIAQEAENRYVGVACGRLDQSCVIHCRKDHLLFMDMKYDSSASIPTAPTMKPYKIAIFFSGLERSLAGSQYNARVDECRAAARALKAFAGMDFPESKPTCLRDIPCETYLAYRHRLPAALAKRAEHWYSEYDRVSAGVQAWRSGDMDTFGRLIFESGYSSIHNYETGSPELKALHEIMTQTDGIYGGRFSGAGFRGCCVALIDPAFAESVKTCVTRTYCKAFPALAEKFSVHVCHTADGIRL